MHRACRNSFMVNVSWRLYFNFRFLLDCCLRWACHWHIGLDRYGTLLPIVEYTYKRRSRTGSSRVAECRYQISNTTSSAIVLSHTCFSLIDIRGDLPPPSLWSLPVETYRCLLPSLHVGMSSLMSNCLSSWSSIAMTPSRNQKEIILTTSENISL